MTIKKLEIDGTDYIQYVREDRPCVVKMQYEQGPGRFVSSTFQCTLDNRNDLQDNFLNNKPYQLFNEGVIKVYNSDLGTADPIFIGYIDKTRIPVDSDAQDIEIRAIGHESYYSNKLTEYDISQIYTTPAGAYSTRQRGGRTSETTRYNVALFQDIDDLIQTMIEDIGIATADINISYNNQTLFKYKYNEDIFGDITQERNVAYARTTGYNDYGILENMNSVKSITFSDADQVGESYNTFLKEFAIITGCIFFFDHSTEEFYFVNRDYRFGVTTPLTVNSSNIIEGSTKTFYRNAHDGIYLQFGDITLALKRVPATPPIPGLVEQVGIGGTGLYSGELYNVSFVSSQWMVFESGFERYKVHASNQPEVGMQMSNALDFSFRSYLADYIGLEYDGVTSGDYVGSTRRIIDDFLNNEILDGYDFVFDEYRKVETTINGEYFAPEVITYDSTTITVWETETDLIDSVTKLRFTY